MSGKIGTQNKAESKAHVHSLFYFLGGWAGREGDAS